MSLVVDGSAALGWSFIDEQTDKLRELARRVARDGANVPPHFKLEYANSMLTAVRRGRATPSEAAGHLADIDALPFAVDDSAALNARGFTYVLGERHKLTAYDVAYLELALRLSAELATLDGDLADAAKVEGVTLVDLGA